MPGSSWWRTLLPSFLPVTWRYRAFLFAFLSSLFLSFLRIHPPKECRTTKNIFVNDDGNFYFIPFPRILYFLVCRILKSKDAAHLRSRPCLSSFVLSVPSGLSSRLRRSLAQGVPHCAFIWSPPSLGSSYVFHLDTCGLIFSLDFKSVNQRLAIKRPLISWVQEASLSFSKTSSGSLPVF